MGGFNNGIKLKVWGDYACFTRPEMKVERVSYDVMTPSSARGILEAVLWKPAITWVITQIDVLKPIRWVSIRRNELGAVISTRNVTTAMESGRGNLGLFIEDERQQRAGLFLRDVEYLIHARFEMTPKSGSEDNPQKFHEMFKRRVEKGQCFNQPYLGCREFSAYFSLINSAPLSPISESRDLGWMLHDLDFSLGDRPARFFRAELRDGCINIPPLKGAEVRG